MKIIKENILTVILILLIIIIIIAVGGFCYKIIKQDKENEDKYLANKNTQTQEVIFDSNNENVKDGELTEKLNFKINPINMSKFYMDKKYGEISQKYNEMLDELGRSKCIVETGINVDCLKSTIDLSRKCFIGEYEGFYECWAYVGGLEKSFKHNYKDGIDEKKSEKSIWMVSEADFVEFAIEFNITDDDMTWEYTCNENVERRNKKCYELIGKWDGSYTTVDGEYRRFDGTKKLYVEMSTNRLIEMEDTFYLNETIGFSTYNKFYEYSDDDLKLPQEAEKFIFE